MVAAGTDVARGGTRVDPRSRLPTDSTGWDARPRPSDLLMNRALIEHAEGHVDAARDALASAGPSRFNMTWARGAFSVRHWRWLVPGWSPPDTSFPASCSRADERPEPKQVSDGVAGGSRVESALRRLPQNREVKSVPLRIGITLRDDRNLQFRTGLVLCWHVHHGSAHRPCSATTRICHDPRRGGSRGCARRVAQARPEGASGA